MAIREDWHLPYVGFSSKVQTLISQLPTRTVWVPLLHKTPHRNPVPPDTQHSKHRFCRVLHTTIYFLHNTLSILNPLIYPSVKCSGHIQILILSVQVRSCSSGQPGADRMHMSSSVFWTRKVGCGRDDRVLVYLVTWYLQVFPFCAWGEKHESTDIASQSDSTV